MSFRCGGAARFYLWPQSELSHFMKRILYILFALAAVPALAQRPAADVIQTSKGALSIQPVKHATVVFTWGGKTIYADPDGGAKAFEGLAEPDLILITDIHGDHYNIRNTQGHSHQPRGDCRSAGCCRPDARKPEGKSGYTEQRQNHHPAQHRYKSCADV